MRNLLKNAIPFLVLASLALLLALTPELFGEDLKEWCELNLGHNWRIIVLSFLALVALVAIKYKPDLLGSLLPDKNETTSPKPEDISDFYPKIKEYLQSRYKSRIEQKLAWRQPVNLRRLPYQFAKADTVNLPFIKYDSDEVKEALAENFEMANGRLLVLGDPGTGKTTLLLQLALELMETQPQALPVVLNLATWTSEFTSLHDWLLAVLPAETGANKTLAAQLLLEKRLVLLFDGFDEIREEDCRSCLDAIAQHGMDARHRYVISSRKKEYLYVADDAPVYFPIEVGLLKIEEIEADLESMGHKEPEALRLLVAIRQDAYLREAVQTPFYLNSLQLLFAKSKNRQDFQFKAKSLKGRKQEIVERFVADALQTPSKQANDTEAAKRWLGFLASRMTRNFKVVFELVDLQYNWWRWWIWQRIEAGIVYGLVDGLTFGLLFGLIVTIIFTMENGIYIGLVIGLFFWLVFGPVVGFLFGILGGVSVIKTKDEPKWSILKYIQILNKNFILLIGSGLILGLIMGLFFELMLEQIGGLIIGAVCGLALGLGGGIAFMLHDSHTSFLQISHPYQRFKASYKSLHFSILQHKHLCWLLTHRGLLPRDLVAFLNEMTERHLLESDGAIFDTNRKITKSGATWRFRHRILQEYFADQWKEPGQ